MRATHGQPPIGASDRHVWEVVYQNRKTGRCTERCQRCGAHFDGFGSAAVWCEPSSVWLACNPEDDGKPRTGWESCYRRTDA